MLFQVQNDQDIGSKVEHQGCYHEQKINKSFESVTVRTVSITEQNKSTLSHLIRSDDGLQTRVESRSLRLSPSKEV